MAQIIAKDEMKVFQIQQFLGLNESEDGDTQLKLGEASVLENWQITPDFHLRVRPGIRTQVRFGAPVRGMWSGYVAGMQKLLCAAEGGLWDITGGGMRRIGDTWDDAVTFFGFGDKVYILNGREYLVWDGEGFVDTVDGYVPLVVSAAAPAGGGTTVEPINRLTGKRRCRFTPDGEAAQFHLPEQGLLNVYRVEVDGAETSAWTADLPGGVVTFDKAPPKGQNTVEVWYTAPNTLRAEVESMRFSELFNGAADTRVFLYGNGTAKAIYCGVTETGEASAEYFPGLYEMTLGDANTPITAMIKHYDRLLTFKPDGAFASEYSTVTLEDGSVTAGFYSVNLNREIGNEAPGQVRLVYNYPRSIYAGGAYDWRMSSATVRDERNAKLVSQRVRSSLRGADAGKIFTFDDDSSQEYYIFLNDSRGTVLVHRYVGDVWYKYTGLPAAAACRMGKEVWFGLTDGRVVRFSTDYQNDDGAPIDARFETGCMDFGMDYKRKHSSVIWVSIKPTANAYLTVTARSDRRGEYLEKAIAQNLSTFRNADFRHWSFLTNRSPQMERLKLKVKKFAFYKLILRSSYAASDATVLGVDLRVRYTGYVK